MIADIGLDLIINNKDSKIILAKRNANVQK